MTDERDPDPTVDDVPLPDEPAEDDVPEPENDEVTEP